MRGAELMARPPRLLRRCARCRLGGEGAPEWARRGAAAWAVGEPRHGRLLRAWARCGAAPG